MILVYVSIKLINWGKEQKKCDSITTYSYISLTKLEKTGIIMIGVYPTIDPGQIYNTEIKET